MKQEARQFIKSEMAKRDLNYVKLAKLMNNKGYITETPDTLRTKIHRGSFSFAFLLEVCDSLNLDLNVTERTK